MLFWGEIEGGNIAPTVHFDIVRLILARRHVIGGAVGDACQHIGQLRVQLIGLGAHRGHFGLLVADQGAQPFKFSLIALGLGGPDFLGCFVLLCLGVFGGRNLAAPCLVQLEHLRRHRRIAPPREGGVESIGIFADGADVMHGGGPWFESSWPVLCRIVMARGRVQVRSDCSDPARWSAGTRAMR